MSKSTEKNQIKTEIEKLRVEIEKHRVAYHVHDTPTISDEVYDSLIAKLERLERENPEFDDVLSPTKRVGGEVLEEFSKFKHTVAQWSFDNVFNFESLVKWEERNLNILKKEGRNDRPTYFTELKIDGLKIVLYYKDGRLQNAVTRGDGSVGEDVTQNVMTIKTIPLTIDLKEEIVVIGELWMSKAEFVKINKEREKEGLEIYKNPRNTAAGTIRQLDPKVVAKRKLNFFAYDLENYSVPNQKDEIAFIGSLGFLTNNQSVYCKDLNEVQKVYEKWNNKKRESEDYGIDGLVIKINEKEIFDALGYTAKSPRGGVAYKFEAEEAATRLLSVTYQVGRTGTVTPVAELEPVELSGSTVARATLHNFDEIERLGVKVGDMVMVRKAGDIIPQVFEVLTSMRNGDEQKITKIKNCPVCKSILVQDSESGGVKLLCINPDCEAKKINKIIYYASRKCANIEGMGESTVSALYDTGLISKVSDIYNLKKEDVLKLEGFKEKSAANLIAGIEKSKTMTLSVFIMGLSIPNVGEETSSDLAKHFQTVQNFLNAKREDLEKIYGIGEKIIEGIVKFLSQKENQREVQNLLKHLKVLDYVSEVVGKSFSDMRFVITGTFADMSREEIEKLIKSNGGSVQNGVNQKTSFLIVGEGGGSKLSKAQELGVKTIDISSFLKMV